MDGKLILEGTSLNNFKSEFSELITSIIRKELKTFVPEVKKDEYLTKQETAKKLKSSVSTINSYRREGILTGYKISGKVFFKSEEVEKALLKMQSIKYKHRG